MADKTVTFLGESSGCRSRMIWQAMFDLYVKCGGDISHLDNLLIDFDNLKDTFRSWAERYETQFVLWGFDTHGATTYMPKLDDEPVADWLKDWAWETHEWDWLFLVTVSGEEVIFVEVLEEDIDSICSRLRN